MSSTPVVMTPAEISDWVWQQKHAYTPEETMDQGFRRVAKSVARTPEEEEEFFALFRDKLFYPGGRIIANAGTNRTSSTMSNCFVMPSVPDSMVGIFETLKNGALTQKFGGGVGYDFSLLRPSGQPVKGIEGTASGPVSFMHVYDTACSTIMVAGQRRGAQIAVLRCDHPDIRKFIRAKSDSNGLKNFNLSVGITDAFMRAVEADRNWELVFGGKVWETVKARDLWKEILEHTYDYAEPGVLFLDTINDKNNLGYCETISAPNPCGEVPLPPNGCCILGSFLLPSFVVNPFSKDVGVDWPKLHKAVHTAVTFMDRILDICPFPLPEQRLEAQSKRRIGIGITGLADALVMLGLKYGSEEGRDCAEEFMNYICHDAYHASLALAQTEGPFPLWQVGKYIPTVHIQDSLKVKATESGTRNSHLLSLAPTGTMSLLAGNISSGVEPIFAVDMSRKIRTAGVEITRQLTDYAVWKYRQMTGDPKSLPPALQTTSDLTVDDHLLMLEVLQKYVDASISKTVNIPEAYPFKDFQDVYMKAWKSGLKGITTYRPNSKIGAVLTDCKAEAKAVSKKQSEELPVAEEVKLLDRPPVLSGKTYKFKDGLNMAYYVTINDCMWPDGVIRPFEMFINTKAKLLVWGLMTMGRLMSSIMRREKDPEFLVEELKSIYDPAGSGYWHDGKFIGSVAEHIGHILEQHLEELRKPAGKGRKKPDRKADTETEVKPAGKGECCPSCGSFTAFRQEGCLKCTSCSYSKCG